MIQFDFHMHIGTNLLGFLALILFVLVVVDLLLYLRVPYSIRRKYSLWNEAIPGSGIWIYFKHRKEQDNGS